MKGVIVAYPGTLPLAFKKLIPSELKLSHDGFEVGKLPTLSTDSRLFSYSSKTLVITNTPARTLWLFYQLCDSKLPHTTFLTSMVHGAHRLNFFNEIWGKVTKEKGISVISVDTIIRSPLRFTSMIESTFGLIWNLPKDFIWNSHKFDKDSLNIINNICGQGWSALQGGNHG